MGDIIGGIMGDVPAPSPSRAKSQCLGCWELPGFGETEARPAQWGLRGAPGAKPTEALGRAWGATRFARAQPWESAGCCGRLSCAKQNLFALSHLEPSPAAGINPCQHPQPLAHPPAAPSPSPVAVLCGGSRDVGAAVAPGQRLQQVAISSAGPS